MEEAITARDIYGVILPTGNRSDFGFDEFVLLGVDGSAIHLAIDPSSTNPTYISRDMSPTGEGLQIYPHFG